MAERIITNELINEFKIYLCGEERSKNTIEKYLQDIRYFIKFISIRDVHKSVCS